MESILQVIVYLVSFGIFYLLGVLIHELGHLIFGLKTGYKFGSFRFLFLVFFKENGKIRVKRTKIFNGGQCLMEPPSDSNNFRFVWYNLGGGLVNLAVVILMFAVYVFSSNIILLAGITANLLLVVFSLVPINLYVPNDGKNVITALKSNEAKHGFFLALFLDCETAAGKRYSEIDEKLFSIKESSDFNNYFVAYILMSEAARLHDVGEYDKSAEHYSLLYTKKLQPYYRNCVILGLLYYYTVHNPDFEKAKELYSDKQMKTHFSMSYIVSGITRTLAAYEFFVNNDKEKGENLLEKARNEAENYPNIGIRIMELDYCEKLEKMFMNDFYNKK